MKNSGEQWTQVVAGDTDGSGWSKNINSCFNLNSHFCNYGLKSAFNPHALTIDCCAEKLCGLVLVNFSFSCRFIFDCC